MSDTAHSGSFFRLHLAVAAFLIALAVTPARAADKPLVLAVHPYLPAAEIQNRFSPFAAYLSRELGRPVTVRVGGNYAEHERAIGNNQVDIAFMGPAPYIQLSDSFGTKPLLARFQVNGQPNLYGVIAVRKDSAATTLTSLRDARIAFGDPESTMSHIVPRYLMLQAGIPKGAARHKFLGSHHNVALGLLAGDYDAAAMKKEVFDEFAPRGLRALIITPGVPDHLFVTRADMPLADIKRLREVMLRLKDQPDGPAIMEKMHKGLSALIPAAESDYAPLRKMIRAVNAANR
jgi:phosphonate transport system substrate-binding protein